MEPVRHGAWFIGLKLALDGCAVLDALVFDLKKFNDLLIIGNLLQVR